VKKPLAGDPLDRLRDEQRQIEELLQTQARHQRDPSRRPAEVSRLAALIFTLLRVHLELEDKLLHPTLLNHLGPHPALARAAAHRAAVSEAIERVEAMSPRDPEYRLEMGSLARRARLWFAADEDHVFRLASDSSLDLSALDDALAARQEEMLAAGVTR
jgi:hypothetical protein